MNNDISFGLLVGLILLGICVIIFWLILVLNKFSDLIAFTIKRLVKLLGRSFASLRKTLTKKVKPEKPVKSPLADYVDED